MELNQTSITQLLFAVILMVFVVRYRKNVNTFQNIQQQSLRQQQEQTELLRELVALAKEKAKEKPNS
ncbi:MAG TPA: hypothetical protein V6C97_19765 [Oculatellaceae cyanobacterium]